MNPKNILSNRYVSIVMVVLSVVAGLGGLAVSLSSAGYQRAGAVVSVAVLVAGQLYSSVAASISKGVTSLAHRLGLDSGIADAGVTNGKPFAAPPAPTRVAIIDRTTDRPDLAPFLPQLADALNEQLNQHFAPHHGGSYVFRVCAPGHRQPGEIAMNVRHQKATDPQGALAWHQVTSGIPDIEINIDSTSGLTGDSNALDVCASHESCEMGADGGANRLVDNLNGTVSALETCDRIEQLIYKASNGLNLSNFLLQSAWMPGASGPYDFMQTLTSQFAPDGSVFIATGGYDIEATAPTDEHDVFGMRETRVLARARGLEKLDDFQQRRKADPYSRTSRRAGKRAA